MVETRPFTERNPYPADENMRDPHASDIFEPRKSGYYVDETLLKGPDLPFLSPPLSDGELGYMANYRVTKVIGHGGMGVVLEAEDTQLKRPVALKVMKKEFVDSYLSRERFLQEARSAASLDSDYIVTIYQVGMTNDVPFLAMQLLQGEPLDLRLEREAPLPMPEAMTIARQVAEGLDVAHENGLVHRDIKPANIWLEREPNGKGFRRVKLLDFGLARNLETTRKLTNVGIIVGTPQFMSPEQASAMPVDGRSDLFSLGTVLYVMLTGEFPFNGPTAPALLMDIVTKDPVPPKQLNCFIPQEVNELILKLLAKKPEHRPASARVVADTIEEIMIEYSFLMPSRSSGVMGFPTRDAMAPPLRFDATHQDRVNAATLQINSIPLVTHANVTENLVRPETATIGLVEAPAPKPVQKPVVAEIPRTKQVEIKVEKPESVAVEPLESMMISIQGSQVGKSSLKLQIFGLIAGMVALLGLVLFMAFR